MNLKHFDIVTVKKHILVPKSEMAISLAAQCASNGRSLDYPTAERAYEAARLMEQAIENRSGRPWDNSHQRR